MALQWGRNLSVAEGGKAPIGIIDCVELQWGRNLSVAEGCGRMVESARRLEALQWGRNLSVAEGLCVEGVRHCQ